MNRSTFNRQVQAKRQAQVKETSASEKKPRSEGRGFLMSGHLGARAVG